jgi:hypothetical protein
VTRSTHLPSPEPAELRALLDAAGWSDYRAAQAIGMTVGAFGQVVRGETRMRGTAWRLLRIMLCQSERAALPPAPLP